MIRAYPLTKRWRTSEYTHKSTRTAIGIYVAPASGEFYAYVPEREDGHLVKASSRDQLLLALKEACAAYLEVAWSTVIRVQLARVGDSFCGSSRAWDPAEPETAGDVIELRYERLDVGQAASGLRLTREYADEQQLKDWSARGWPDMRRTSQDLWTPEPGVQAELPYSDATWEALADFQRRIRELNHSLRTLIARADLEPMLLQAARRRLFAPSAVGEDEPGGAHDRS